MLSQKVVASLVAVVLIMSMSPHVVHAETSTMISPVMDRMIESTPFVSFGSQTERFPVSPDRVPRRVANVRLSFYTSSIRETDSTPCIPADGSNLCLLAEQGVVDSLATNRLALGTTVRFPELEIAGVVIPSKQFKVRDRMNDRYTQYSNPIFMDMYVAVLDESGKIDLVASRQFAKSLGVKYTKVEIF